jgi:hypothetical protein
MLEKKKQTNEIDSFNENKEDLTGESLRLQDVENFFKYAINPSLIEAKIEKATAALMKERGGLPLPLIIAVAIVMVAGGIAYTMIANQYNSSDLQNKYIGCETQLATYKTPVVTTAQKSSNGVIQ